MSIAGESGTLQGIGLAVITLTVITVDAREIRADGLSPRTPWTGSRMAGTPEPPPPYTVEPAFPHVKLRFPVALVPAKGTDRLFAGELPGRIVSFPNDPECRKV